VSQTFFFIALGGLFHMSPAVAVRWQPLSLTVTDEFIGLQRLSA